MCKEWGLVSSQHLTNPCQTVGCFHTWIIMWIQYTYTKMVNIACCYIWELYSMPHVHLEGTEGCKL
jgi:hypothetical protein